MAKRAFSFLDMPRRSEKPRVNGMTMCIDQGLGFDFVKGLLEMSSDYIDLWKLGWTTTQLQPLELVKKKISLLRSHHISVCNGGTLLELSEHQGKAETLFDELVNYDGYAGDNGELRALYEFVKKYNVKFEWIGMNGKIGIRGYNFEQVALKIVSIELNC